MADLPPPPGRALVTGLVLAGGRATRMGGVDKGLQLFRGQALVDHALSRLAPQVGELMISANRNADFYAARVARVLVDATNDFAGPLAGVLAGLRASRTPWVAVVPCDAPLLPPDLVMRLAQAVAGSSRQASGAVVERDQGGDRGRRVEPVCCLLSTTLADDLAAYLASGERQVERWLSRHALRVAFDRDGDIGAFANFNTLDDLLD